jgi:hypothetical protein
LIVFFLVKAVLSRIRRLPGASPKESKKKMDVDPETIRDAEFTEVQDAEESRK